MGSLVQGVGPLVCAIGIGTLIAGYLYPNTSEELTNAVEGFEGNSFGQGSQKFLNNLERSEDLQVSERIV